MGVNHMSDQLRNWSPGQAMLPPDPNHHNRMLDRVAAEHLREVAPGLAPCLSCQAGLCAEHGPTVTATTTGAPASCGHDHSKEVGERDGITLEPRLLLAVPLAPAPPADAKHHEEDCVCRKCRPELHSAQPPAEVTNPVKTLSALLLAGSAKLVTRLTAAQACDVVREIARQNGHDVVIEAPAPGATGEMSDSVVAALVGMIAPQRGEDSDDRYSRERAIKELLDGIAALRARASEAEERAERAERNYKAARDCEEKRGNEWSRHALKVTRERDEAREQRDDLSRENKGLRDQRDAISDQREDLANEILAERAARLRAEAEVKRLNDVVDGHARDSARAGLERDRAEHRLKLATEEIVRVRLAYDDPSLDATDGAHPAWWRGSDAGVAGAVRIVNEALDEPLPLAGCVGGADLERVRQRIAALRERNRRLEEAGDAMVEAECYDWPNLVARWKAAKADAPAAKGTK